MAFDDTGDDSAALSQINVTPLVDVMLVLLIIFMVAAPVIQQGVELELPKETISPVEGAGEKLIVSINSEGEIFVGSSNPVTSTGLGDKVKAILKEKGEDRVYIRADKSVAYGKVMEALGAIRRSGIVNVGLLTEPSK